MPAKFDILIIEDDELYAKYVSSLINHYLNLNVFIASNPKIGFDFLDNNKPKLIILDLELPMADGYSITKKLKSDISTKDIPIIICSALHQKDLIVKLVQAGANDYIYKRADKHTILSKVRKALVSHH